MINWTIIEATFWILVIISTPLIHKASKKYATSILFKLFPQKTAIVDVYKDGKFIKTLKISLDKETKDAIQKNNFRQE